MTTPVVDDFWMNHALEVIKNDFGEDLTISGKSKDLLKFGKTEDLPATGDWTTLWNVAALGATARNETYVDTNIIDAVSSSDVGDDQTIFIEGHEITSDGFIFVVREVTLNGQTQVTFPGLARVSRLYNDGASEYKGSLFVAESTPTVAGEPTDKTKVHLLALADDQQSAKGATTLSSTDYWIITEVYAAVRRRANTSVDFQIQTREFGKAFRTRIPLGAHSNSAGVPVPLRPHFIIPPNTDVRIRASSDTAASATGFLNGVLASSVNL